MQALQSIVLPRSDRTASGLDGSGLDGAVVHAEHKQVAFVPAADAQLLVKVRHVQLASRGRGGLKKGGGDANMRERGAREVDGAECRVRNVWRASCTGGGLQGKRWMEPRGSLPPSPPVLCGCCSRRKPAGRQASRQGRLTVTGMRPRILNCLNCTLTLLEDSGISSAETCEGGNKIEWSGTDRGSQVPGWLAGSGLARGRAGSRRQPAAAGQAGACQSVDSPPPRHTSLNSGGPSLLRAVSVVTSAGSGCGGGGGGEVRYRHSRAAC